MRLHTKSNDDGFELCPSHQLFISINHNLTHSTMLSKRISQYVLIAQAGLSDSSMKEMKLEEIHNMMSEFKLIVEDFVMRDGLRGNKT